MIVSITEEQRQIMVLALVEMQWRRPGWADVLTHLVDSVLEAPVMAREIHRLRGEVDAVGSRDWQERVRALELAQYEMLLSITRLEGDRSAGGRTGDARDRPDTGGAGRLGEPAGRDHPGGGIPGGHPDPDGDPDGL